MVMGRYFRSKTYHPCSRKRKKEYRQLIRVFSFLGTIQACVWLGTLAAVDIIICITYTYYLNRVAKGTTHTHTISLFFFSLWIKRADVRAFPPRACRNVWTFRTLDPNGHESCIGRSSNEWLFSFGRSRKLNISRYEVDESVKIRARSPSCPFP